LQLPTILIESLKSGKITISQRNVKQLEVKVQEKRIDVNATDKELIKEVISAALEGPNRDSISNRLRKSVGSVRAANEARPLVKDIVEDLCREGVTVTISYKGDKVVTIGSEANSKLTRLVTGTKGIQINNAVKLAELGI
jgi:hypothetical protein